MSRENSCFQGIQCQATLFYETRSQFRHAQRSDEIRSSELAETEHDRSAIFFKAARQNSEAATKVSFLISEAIAKRGKPLSDGDFVKDCVDIFTSVVCPDKSRW